MFQALICFDLSFPYFLHCLGIIYLRPAVARAGGGERGAGSRGEGLAGGRGAAGTPLEGQALDFAEAVGLRAGGAVTRGEDAGRESGGERERGNEMVKVDGPRLEERKEADDKDGDPMHRSEASAALPRSAAPGSGMLGEQLPPRHCFLCPLLPLTAQ